MFNTEKYKDKIPENILTDLIAWGQWQYSLGQCLTALLANDLFGFASRADEETMQALPHIIKFVVNELPNGCYGSPLQIKHWKSDPRFGKPQMTQ